MSNKKIYTNTLAQIAWKVMTAFISIFLIKILTNYLDVAGYGLYSKIYNFLSIFAVIADMGLYTITVRELSKHSDNTEMIDKISSNVLTLRTISGIFIIWLSLLIAPFLSWYDSQMAMIGILIAGFFTLTGLMNSSLMSYLQATLRAEFSFIANTAGKMLTFGMILICASILFPLQSWISEISRYTLVMIAGLAGNTLMLGLTWWYTRRYIRIRFAWDTHYIKEILTLSLPYWLALFLGAIFFKVDTVLLSIMEDVQRADIAIALYALPMKIIEVGMMYGTVFLNSVLPVLTTSIEKKNKIETEKIITNAFQVLFAFWLGLSLFLMIYGREILLLLSGKKFMETSLLGFTTWDAMSIVAWVFLFYFISSLLTYTLIARGEQKKMIWINGTVAIINIIGNLIIIPQYSFIGSAWVTLFSQFLLILITGWYVRHDISHKKMILFIVPLTIVWMISGYLSQWLVWVYSQLWKTGTDLFIYLATASIVFGVIFLGGWWGIKKILK
jgi:O-antigen/teichoic acid export membrane protein